ncbi:fetal and adult testis-expressed transcript protein [Rhinolophus sinicus]|uniref:fetal and adult testis-expressed transcript protein n=1 Tax=Rhinolophus sinicus TaxID=89399 RepID=UPI003D7B1801
MAESPSNITQEMEISMAEELAPESHGQRQEHLMIDEILERAYSSLGASQRRQNLNSKAAGSAASQMIWNMTGTWPKKVVLYGAFAMWWLGCGWEYHYRGYSLTMSGGGTQLQIPIMSSEPSHEDVQCPEDPGSFQGTKVQYECNPEADLIAEIGLEELTGLEMEVMRRQMHMITERLCALENQVTAWRYKGVVFFTVLVSACALNLWQWLRH